MRQKTPVDGECTYVGSNGKCREPYKASGYCAGHYRRAQLGQGMDPPIRSFKRASTEERFWPFVQRRDDGCWMWGGCRETQGGYGQFYDDRFKRARRAHVVMWELVHNRPVPENRLVRHSCDNPACVRPEHLLLGTHADNMADMAVRRRHRGNRRLTEEDVLAIRCEYANGTAQKILAERYGVIQQTISQIVTHKTWTHID